MSSPATTIITPEIIAKAMNYEAYRTLVREKIANNQSTGTDHSEAMVGYTKMNEQRMKRLDKKIQLLSEVASKLAAIETSQIWLVLTEGWCGDAAQTVPIMAKMAAENLNIELKFLLRDENLAVMNEFLTNGGRSIPKLIVLDKKTLHVLGSWGPRPAELQGIFLEAKASPDFNYPEIQKVMQIWYNKNKGVNTQEEIVELL